LIIFGGKLKREAFRLPFVSFGVEFSFLFSLVDFQAEFCGGNFPRRGSVFSHDITSFCFVFV